MNQSAYMRGVVLGLLTAMAVGCGKNDGRGQTPLDGAVDASDGGESNQMSLDAPMDALSAMDVGGGDEVEWLGDAGTDGGNSFDSEQDAACPPGSGAGSHPCIRTLTPFYVCGTDFSVYRNPGFAYCACADVLHTGSCMAGEGAECVTDDTCAPGQYCAPSLGRCVLSGACLADEDCLASSLGSDGGVQETRCSEVSYGRQCVN